MPLQRFQTASKVGHRGARALRRILRGGPALLLCAALALVGCKSEAEKHYDAAKRLRDSGEFEKAIEEFLAAAELQADHHKAHYRAAEIYRDDLFNADKAIEHFRRTVEINPLYYRAWKKMIDLYITKDDTDTAIKTIQEAIRSGAFDSEPDEKDELYDKLEDLKKKQEKEARPPAQSPQKANAPAPSKVE
jgi:tetratricopeptide (TPR) repeat protein